MGIVIRQSFWSTIAAYIGVAIGYFNIVILMPKFFSPEEIGLYRTIIGSAAILTPLPLFGLRSAFIRFFPRNSDQQNGTLLLWGLIVFLTLLVGLTLSAIFMKPFLESFFEEKAAAINDYLWLILLLIALMGIFGFQEAILKAKKDIATPNFIREALLKLLQAGVIVLVGFSLISVHDFLVAQAYIYLSLIIIIFLFVIKKSSFRLSIRKSDLSRPEIKEFFTYSRYALLSGMGTVMVLQVDQIMISKYIGLDANAIYTTAVFMAVVIELPRKFVAQISQPIITEDFQNERFDKINQDYKKASINQLIMGAYIFLGIAINLPNIYSIMPNGHIYSAGMPIVYIIGCAKLVNMVFSINGEIIVMSKHYRVNIFLIAMLGFFTVGLNLFLIPKYGIEGAACASLLTLFVFNLIKFVYVKIKFNFSPFSRWTLPCILIIPLSLLLNSLFDYSESAILDIAIRSTILSIGFFAFVVLAKPSRELADLIQKVLTTLRLKN